MPKIDQMYAYVIADKDENDEGVPAVHAGDDMVYPLMGADIERARQYERHAQMVADKRGKPIELRVFRSMETVKVIHPRAKA